MPGDSEVLDVAVDEERTGEPQTANGNRAADTPLLGASAMAFLEALRSGSVDPQKVMMSALAGQGDDNPHIGMLLKLVEEQGSGGNVDQLREDLREEIRAEQAEAVEQLSETARRLYAEVEASRSRLEALAAALGACPNCFGDDLLCDTCGGEGTPGSRTPQADEFHRYVRPAVERVRALLRRAPPRRPWPRNPSARPADPPTATEVGAGS
ncbi:hypothetical protein KXR53_33715 [Inquilinus limosus]|uniref:hypothetical protein n=1 Tax=Inquilinus limosus TaxID=171674 RepID=UPI003F15EDED